MNRLAVIFIALVATVLCTFDAAAQNIRYEFNGTTTDVVSGQDIVINVGVVSGTQLLQLYDPALVGGLPDDDVGKITIRGSVEAGGELRILVAGTADSWPPDIFTPLANTGVRNLGLDAADGFAFEDASGQPSPDLRNRTRLAAFTSGDMRGEIAVGQVQRLQCGFDPSNFVPGTISANITAFALDNSFTSNERTCHHLSQRRQRHHGHNHRGRRPTPRQPLG